MQLSLTDRLSELQDTVSQMPQCEIDTHHIFHGGMYCRQVFHHAGVLIVGRVHKKEHFCMIVSGTVVITTDDGAMEVTGPYLFCSKPGTKRAALALTDTLCITIHRVDSDTVEDVESELVEEDPNSMYTVGNQLKRPELENTL